MRYTQRGLIGLVLGSIFISGCVPDGLPAYVNGGMTVVATTHSEKEGWTFWTYDIETGKVLSHALAGWQLSEARVIDDQIWTEWCRNDNESTCKLFDPAQKKFTDGPKEPEQQNWFSSAIPASHEGKKCLFIPGDRLDNGKRTYDVLSFPGLNKTLSDSFDKILSAGGFKWVLITENDVGKLGRIGVYDQQGKKVLGIGPEEARKAPYIATDRFAGYALINEEEKVLLIATAEQGSFAFGVFDLNNGKFLWGGTPHYVITGIPLLKRNEIWSFEDRDANGGKIVLVRQTPGDKPDECKREVARLERWLGGQYTPSPDGTHFVMVGYPIDRSKPAQLLFIPVKKDVTEKDVKVVDLVASK